MSNTAPAAGAALSIDQAVALMDKGNQDEMGSVRAVETPQSDRGTATDQATRDDAETGDGKQAQDALETAAVSETADPQEETDEQPTRNPPSHWNAEERAIFAKQSPE